MSPHFGEVTVPESNQFDIVIKVWVRAGSRDPWTLFIRWHADLRHLSAVPNVEIDDVFHDNCVIVKLQDQYYTSASSMKKASRTQSHSRNHTYMLGSYSFDGIRSLNSLDKSIKELHHSKHTISKTIDTIIDNKNNLGEEVLSNESLRLKVNLGRLSKDIIKQRSTNDNVMSEIMNLKIKINEISSFKDDGKREFTSNAESEIQFVQNQIPNYQDSLDGIFSSMRTHLKRFGTIISDIIQIEKRDDMYNLYVMGLEFPANIQDLLHKLYHEDSRLGSEYDLEEGHSVVITQINTGIWYIIQTVEALIQITNLQVYYAIRVQGERVVIEDFKGKCYPLLYDPASTKKSNEGTKNQPFETAIMLLNKDLLLVLHNVSTLYRAFDPAAAPLLNNIPIDCLDNFLWNLQYVLLYITAGEV
ncbi:hypothetical protein CANTEDRAFT_102197 [Yamadazyma tenuis ATCC 10573]|uniref:Uncharacterized protein n=1 Tax=Candida tenuis (strain ATCC 10573 / BCRC 21748 / CBS 615 / JCM 9827 / NBRC 10315 / NRRL Y-1498 / VKM Y-70) TaxID=590646 RepID=G3AZM4_CANTC|nr:uncharacterized protein CANTEDRAFT_102197 [Yamadazyma tenuis ATCC 10573]EGV65620.1 hypothetical protein CANTEDRAFT_102197 [Yamadazyma tenuis ATCC 10573]